MRILMIAPPWLTVPPVAYGGIELIVSALSDGLVEAGHDVTLVASGGSKTRARLQRVFDVPPFEHLGDARIEAVHALSAYLGRADYDIIHDHTMAVGPALAVLSDHPPVVHTLHHPWSDAQVRLARLVSSRVHLVAISRDQAARAPRDIPIAGVVHNGIPVERYPFRGAKERFLLFVGRASPDKGPEAAIDVAERLGRPLVIGIKINEPSEHRYWRETLQPLIEASSVRVDVVPNPEHERKVDLMSRAAAVLMPIQWPEPFGLVMAEANACGTPVVAYAVGAAPEIIINGRSGFLVEPGDVDGYCAAVERAAALDPRECRRHIVAHFSAQRMVAGYEQVYRQAAGGLAAIAV